MSVLSSFNLKGKNAVVTGASQGLGEAMAIALAEAGANLVLVANTHVTAAQQVAERIENLGPSAVVAKANVTNSNEVKKMVDIAVENFGSIDVLVNNAGTNKWIPTLELEEQTWNEIIGVNLTGVFLCSQYVGREMVKKKGGSIINIASMCAEVNTTRNKKGDAAPCLHYYSSKAGVVMLTKALALEWINHGIRVNCISPGYFGTPLLRKLMEENRELYEAEILGRTPMRRMGNPRELGGAAVFLASDASSYMTGQNLIIDGGYVLW